MTQHLTILANEAALDEDGWALIAPFGEHPKTRYIKKNGEIQREQFIQVLDHQSADQLLSRENSLFRRIRRAVVGIPVYKGHPDLGDFSPEIAGSAKKEIIGTIDQVRKTERGLEAHFVLKLLSAGLTAHPNISGVESLANTRHTGPTQEPIPTKEPDMKLIAGWLLANGATLAHADSPAESEVLAAMQKLHASASGEAAALGNENSTLTAENADLKSHVSNLKSSATALENEKNILSTQVQTERKGRAAAVVDLAIARGKLAVSERPARLQALENSGDFDREAAVLLDSAARFKTAGNAESGKILSNHGATGDAREEYCAAVERHMKETGESDPVKAHDAVMKNNPGLAEQLRIR